MSATKHRITWSDDGMAGYTCDSRVTNATLDRENNPRTCVLCGATLHLHWDVRIEEVAPVTGDKT